MLFAIDIGNSHTVIGLFEGRELRHHWRLQTDRRATADEINATLHGLFAASGRDLRVGGMVLASVVPQLLPVWREVADALACEPLVVDAALDTGVAIRAPNPAEVGADRIVNAAAGFHRFRQSLIIVDFGTAITFDCVSEDGAYLGGAIAPGMGIAVEALGERTAKLPRVDLGGAAPAAIGTDTISAIRSGILFGYGGMVTGLIDRLRQELLPARPRVIATGGMAGLIAPYAPAIEEVIPHLTLEGLRLIHERHA